MKRNLGIVFGLLSALLFAICIPLSKLLLSDMPSTLLAGFLYLGGGLGMSLIYGAKKIVKKEDNEKNLDKSDLKYIILMIALDIVAPICLYFAVYKSSASVVSLLSNFEIVATTIIALIIFKEVISNKLWIGIILIALASIILSVDFSSSFSFSWYSILALVSAILYGLENNCTKAISGKNPYQVVIVKGLASGVGILLIGLLLKEQINNYIYILYVLLLGFSSYGLSVLFYVLSERYIGAPKASSFFSLAPFIGSILSLIIFKERPVLSFYIALCLMIIGIFFVLLDRNKEIETQ